jgi:hypothetical protein
MLSASLSLAPFLSRQSSCSLLLPLQQVHHSAFGRPVGYIVSNGVQQLVKLRRFLLFRTCIGRIGNTEQRIE